MRGKRIHVPKLLVQKHLSRELSYQKPLARAKKILMPTRIPERSNHSLRLRKPSRQRNKISSFSISALSPSNNEFSVSNLCRMTTRAGNLCPITVNLWNLNWLFVIYKLNNYPNLKKKAFTTKLWLFAAFKLRCRINRVGKTTQEYVEMYKTQFVYPKVV